MSLPFRFELQEDFGAVSRFLAVVFFFQGCLTSIGTKSSTSLPSRIRLWEGLGACWLQSLSIEILLQAQLPFTHQHSFNPYFVLELLSYIALLSTPFMSCFASSLHLLDSSLGNLLKVFPGQYRTFFGHHYDSYGGNKLHQKFGVGQEES